MPKGTNQKLKLIYLMKIMLEKTDENHGITMPEILKALEAYDISAERKSIYTDFDAIRDFGIDVVGEPYGKSHLYRVVSRQFEIAELKLLVDAIQSSKFITEKKSHELIKKLESFASNHEAKQLQRQVYVSGRIKAMNESIYYNVDEIHAAIASNKKLTFQYCQWNMKKELDPKKNGELYIVSPWALCWDDENYYMIGYDATEDKIKHYRVDKMQKSECIEEPREGADKFNEADMVGYTQRRFGMFDGEEEEVKLLFENRLIGVVMDRFGKDTIVAPAEDGYFTIRVKVAVSNQFFGWIFGLGSGVKILEPENVVTKMKEHVSSVYDNYR